VFALCISRNVDEYRPSAVLLLALFARADLPQIAIRVNAGGMAVVPVELDRIGTDGRCADDLDWSFPIDREGIGSGLHNRRLVAASGTGTPFAQIGVSISCFVAVIPLDEYASGCRELDGDRKKGHLSRHGNLVLWAALGAEGRQLALAFNYRRLWRIEVCDADLSGNSAGEV
jgi:hypothetical protein